MIPYTPPKPADHIPMIDLTDSFSADPTQRAAVAWEIHKAARDTGFFYIANHGIDQRVVERAFVEARRFFDLPSASRHAVSVDKWPCRRGYDPMEAQILDAGSPPDLKESFYLARHLEPDHPYVKKKVPNHGPNQWPEDLPGYREGLEAYYHPMVDLGRHLMRLLAMSLSLDEAFFDDAFRDPIGTLRLIHYPPHPADAAANQLGAGAHSDYSAISLLAQDDCGGLEVENAAGEWIWADPIPGTFVVNLGEIMKRWTNDLYHSAMHRVLNKASGQDRYSMVMFFSPDFFTRVECVPTCRPDVGEPKYEPCTAGETIAELVRRSYSKDAA